jgi:predicted SAM-dependent methyltransferase
VFSISLKKVLCPTKLQQARKLFGTMPIRVLDVGCGNRSCEVARHWLNIIEYVGVDRDYWNDDKVGYEGIDRMIFVDLERDPSLSELEDNSFDFIILNHVIEHLVNGEDVLMSLYKKLRFGGIIYVETPDIATLNYPSAIGFMNFYDDPTHKHIYEIHSLVSEMMRMGFFINYFGRRRDWYRVILFSPPMLLWNLFFSIPFKRRLDARGLWDLFGVSSFVIASRKALCGGVSKRPDTVPPVGRG